jgi:outer membrane receptor for ferrienterochelin and colicins
MIFITSWAWAEEPLPEESEEAEEVVVTGTRTPRPLGTSPVAVEVIGQEEIARSGAYDVAELLENQAGLDIVRNQFGATVRLRGLNENQTLVLVDGQRLVGRTGGAQDLSRIPVEDIERIEIVKGPASALYGADALGGVVHIVTRSAREPQASVGLRGGTLLNVDGTASASVGSKKVGARLTGGWHGSPTVDRDLTTQATSLDSERQGRSAAGWICARAPT